MGTENDKSSDDLIADLLKKIDAITAEAKKTSADNSKLKKLLSDCNENLEKLKNEMLELKAKVNRNVGKAVGELDETLVNLTGTSENGATSSETDGDNQVAKKSETDGDNQVAKKSETDGDNQVAKKSETDGDNQVAKKSAEKSTGILGQMTDLFQSGFRSEEPIKPKPDEPIIGGSSRRRKKNKYTRRKKKNKSKRRYTRGKK
jgi:chromosome segregation ATPase